jgi:hypothetical protein
MGSLSAARLCDRLRVLIGQTQTDRQAGSHVDAKLPPTSRLLPRHVRAALVRGPQALAVTAARSGVLLTQWLHQPYIAGYKLNRAETLSAARDVALGFVSGLGSREVVGRRLLRHPAIHVRTRHSCGRCWGAS